MHLPFTTLDIFTTTPYFGNPLAVIRVPSSLREQLTEEQKQKIAREFNLSEVTFLHECTNSSDAVDFDIFTSKSRITFAGHPTIGTAIYVAQHPDAYPGITELRTLAGSIPFKYDAASGKSTVSVPHDVHIHSARVPHPTQSTASVPIVSIVKGMAFGLCELPDLETLGSRSGPLIAAEDRYKAQFLDAGSGWDVGYTGSFYFVDLGSKGNVRSLRTRSIPAFEDPGTGSASAALCCYIAITEKKRGRVNFHLVQGMEMGRRCDIFVDVDMEKDGTVQGVELSGVAVGVMEGSLAIE
ncbi:phenazine biosynthesis protein-like protein phzf family [Ophiobolus disseminans]|uniref:Phenazine biosynthesis protein-like protein phzf family n=1 Tax=Ophiobolus disseminans TaxID=1469910 RepID=A0A6A7A6C5_9PLEO|nr:phenazine biosynthesis protein-like protein phzf family [Ophiobolus disseminans]